MPKADKTENATNAAASSSAASVAVTASPVVSLEPKSKGAPNGWLSIRIPLDPSLSKSGKSTVLASTRGSLKTDVHYDGRPIMLGLNAFVYEPKS